MQRYAPRILIIEEAGQVLEAHILATLFPSVQHLIAIGDPKQLRPSVSHGEQYTSNEANRRADWQVCQPRIPEAARCTASTSA